MIAALRHVRASACSPGVRSFPITAGKEHDGVCRRDAVGKRCTAAHDAVTAQHRDPDHLSVGQADRDRNRSAVRKVDVFQRGARLAQDSFPDHFDRHQMRAQQIKIRRIEHLQQLVRRGPLAVMQVSPARSLFQSAPRPFVTECTATKLLQRLYRCLYTR